MLSFSRFLDFAIFPRLHPGDRDLAIPPRVHPGDQTTLGCLLFQIASPKLHRMQNCGRNGGSTKERALIYVWTRFDMLSCLDGEASFLFLVAGLDCYWQLTEDGLLDSLR